MEKGSEMSGKTIIVTKIGNETMEYKKFYINGKYE